MTDIVDASTRSRMMSGIQGKNTKPEMLIRKSLHAKGFRYSLHRKDLPGRPDIVMPKWKVAIFVHGCFWHQHGCAISKLPSSNTEFWRAKFLANRERDKSAIKQLHLLDWRVATVWECDTRGQKANHQFAGLIQDLTTWIRKQPDSSNWGKNQGEYNTTVRN